MQVLLQNRQKRRLSQAALRRVALAVMRAEGCPGNAQVSVLLGADRRLRTLNRRWRGKDAATDVLAFSQLELPVVSCQLSVMRKNPQLTTDNSQLILGDVVISVQTAARQAKEAGISTGKEVEFLLAHGILHLLGWKDNTAERRRKMLARQEEILSRESRVKGPGSQLPDSKPSTLDPRR